MTVEYDSDEAETWLKFPTVSKKALDGDPVAAIQLFCLTCSGFERETVRDCSSHSCPLWAFRPYRRDGEKRRANAIPELHSLKPKFKEDFDDWKEPVKREKKRGRPKKVQ